MTWLLPKTTRLCLAFWAVALTRPEQLPDIPSDDDLYLTWDADYSEGKDQPGTVIRNGDQVLFSEPAAWEAIGDHCRDGRYEGICKILKAKYGDRVRDLVPTERSWIWLYGDSRKKAAFGAQRLDQSRCTMFGQLNLSGARDYPFLVA